jgi:hypothetical protein
MRLSQYSDRLFACSVDCSETERHDRGRRENRFTKIKRSVVRCCITVMLTLASANAADLGREARPTLEDCASELSSARIVSELTVTRRGPRFVPQLTTNIKTDSDITSTPPQQELACWQQALGMPDPKSRSVSLRFGGQVFSRAPGLDASVRDAALESADTSRSADAREQLDRPRPTLPECATRYLGGDGDAVRIMLTFSRLNGRALLEEWNIHTTDPVKLEAREKFQLFGRCFTGLTGTQRFLQPLEVSGGQIAARSRQ